MARGWFSSNWWISHWWNSKWWRIDTSKHAKYFIHLSGPQEESHPLSGPSAQFYELEKGS